MVDHVGLGHQIVAEHQQGWASSAAASFKQGALSRREASPHAQADAGTTSSAYHQNVAGGAAQAMGLFEPLKGALWNRRLWIARDDLGSWS